VARGRRRTIALASVPDPPRLVAYELLRAVAEQQAYANLVLPSMIRERRLSARSRAA